MTGAENGAPNGWDMGTKEPEPFQMDGIWIYGYMDMMSNKEFMGIFDGDRTETI